MVVFVDSWDNFGGTNTNDHAAFTTVQRCQMFSSNY